MIEVINKEVTLLGWCLIDIFKFPGHLYEDYDISPIKQKDVDTYENCYVEKLPSCSSNMNNDSQYFKNSEEFIPRKLVKIVEKVNDNGWTRSFVTIKDVETNEVLIYRPI